ncbi:RNB domain-containing protein [Paramicrobacterium humi]|uniref:RNB domain-containing protein n=1 Tax=Paramicrobacterium humi TaxID=640635 RepID=A0A1H4PJ29_9MICO|nr:RNB domain-containing ribonuclease [Microbacterium humi]SEC07389.1 RNB domain-containing protein [Microbacterium humi]
MPRHSTHVAPGLAHGRVLAALEDLRDRLELPEAFPDAAVREAEAAAASDPPVEHDMTHVPFVTIDPKGSRDLDQAMHLTATADGFTVLYAIADVPAVVTPGSALDAEARRRVETIYLPTRRIPLHPLVLSEGASSLLPGKRRRAFVWTLHLSADGTLSRTELRRAEVCSRRAWNYEDAQASIDSNAPDPMLALLKRIGELRAAVEHERGGASLNVPDVEVDDEDGRYVLVRRRPLPVEDWNAQISLLTGMAAARIMLDGGVGILRTMPPPTREAEAEFRAQTVALGQPWLRGMHYGDYLRTVDPDVSAGLAILHAAASLFRGAGYTAFDGAAPAETMQSAIAAPYAHVTAPLRRLVDRFGLVVCEALANQREVPSWARESLGDLPAIMATSKSAEATRLSTDIIEAASVAHRVGDLFPAEVVSAGDGRGRVQIAEPPITASCTGSLEAGSRVTVRLVTADVEKGAVQFELA